MSVLFEILEHKRREIDDIKRRVPIASLQERVQSLSRPASLANALRLVPIGLIAEVKRQSPSAGMIREPFYPRDIAKAYESAGAQAISVLIDREYFGGGEDIFKDVREVVTLPMLYKEFVVDEWQIYHAALLGASAVLLIAAALDEGDLREYMRIASSLGLEVLFEVHNAEEMSLAKKLNPPLVGINNRDLKTFEVSLEHTLDLKDKAPSQATLVSESGIKSHEDVLRLRDAGVHGILVGQQLLENEKDPAREIDLLMHANRKP